MMNCSQCSSYFVQRMKWYPSCRSIRSYCSCVMSILSHVSRIQCQNALCVRDENYARTSKLLFDHLDMNAAVLWSMIYYVSMRRMMRYCLVGSHWWICLLMDSWKMVQERRRYQSYPQRQV